MFKRIFILVLFSMLLFSTTNLEAGLFNKIKNKAKQAGRTVKRGAKTVSKGARKAGRTVSKGASKAGKAYVSGLNKVKKKIEHKLGWDRYILCWGDTFVPPSNRWVAIRTAIPKGKHDMGRFWDVPGDGKQTKGPRKKLQLWGITFQEYPQADRRYRFISVYERTKNPDDFGYYLIQSKTGYYVQARGKGVQVWLNKGYNVNNRKDPNANSYQWRVKNVGKNKFVFTSRKYNKAIDARGGRSGNGTVVQLWDDNNQKPVQWEFIYIAEGREVKSTGQMAKNRANEVRKMTKNVLDQFGKIAKKVGSTVSSKAKKGLNKLGDKLISLKQNGNQYSLKVGFPNQQSVYDQLKAKTVDKYFKLDFKKIKFEPKQGNKIVIGFINRLECLGHHVDLSFELTGKWEISKSGFRIKDFYMNKFSLPFLPDKLTKGIRSAISKQTKNLKIVVKNIKGLNNISKSAGDAPLKVKQFKKGPYGFEATLAVN